MKRPVFDAMSLFAACVISLNALAADSLQFRGPTRDGIFADTGLLKTWPAEGPALAWKADGVGAGYGGVSVANGTIYTTGAEGGQGFLYALDLTGKQKWKKPYAPETDDSMAPGARCTPTVDGDKVYVMSGLGVLTCFNAADGAQVWQVDVMKTFNGKVVQWAIAESPLVDGDMVFATPGGPDASVVALDKKTGKTIWQSKGLSDPSAYCSPNIYTFGGHRVLVTMLAKSVDGIDEKTGAPLWSHPFETNYDIHAVTPVVKGNVLYYTGGYGSGGGAIDVSADGTKVTQKWLDKNLDCQHHGVVLIDGFIYGTGHNHNKLFCIELATGTVKWSSEEVKQGEIIYADGMLYIYQGPKSGIVALVKASPEKFELAGSFPVPPSKDKHWANPAIANGRLYIRNAGTIYAYTIAEK